jgi:hypothetical protein
MNYALRRRKKITAIIAKGCPAVLGRLRATGLLLILAIVVCVVMVVVMISVMVVMGMILSHSHYNLC